MVMVELPPMSFIALAPCGCIRLAVMAEIAWDVVQSKALRQARAKGYTRGPLQANVRVVNRYFISKSSLQGKEECSRAYCSS